MSLIEEINAQMFDQPCAFRIRSYEKPGSTIVHVLFKDPANSYHIKIKRPQARLGSDTEATRRALEREHANLCELNRVQPTAFAIPRPIFFSRDRLILATSTVPGQAFLRKHSLLTRLMPSWATGLADDLERVGRALRALHDLDLPFSKIPEEDYTERFNTNIASPIMPLPEHLQRSLSEYGACMTAGMRERDGMKSCHNDFTTHNLLVAPEHIAVLDFDGLAQNHPERDFATLYTSMLDMLPHLPTRDRRMRTLWSHVCRGYGRTITVGQMGPFLIDALVAHVLELSARLTEHQSIHRRWHLRSLLAVSRSELASLVSTLTLTAGAS